MKKKVLFSVLTVVFSLFAFGQTFDVDNLRYTVISGTDVSVRKTNVFPTGNLTIPATVVNGGTTYSVTTIPGSGFGSCPGLTSVTIPNSVTTIGENAFAFNPNITSINIPSSLTTIPNLFCYGCSITSLNIPNSVTNIGAAAFFGCDNLNAIIIPNSVTFIGNQSFLGCSSLTSLTIGSSVNIIQDDAFRNCTGLTSVTVNWATPLVINANVFLGVNTATIPLNVPSGTVAAYQAAAVWSNFASITEQPAPISNTFSIANNTNLITSGNVNINYSGGTLTNNGTLTNPNGTLIFSSPVTYEGTGTAITNGLEVVHAGTSTLNNRINVSGTLAINNGNLDANNNLTLLSNASGTAVIAPVPATSAITGKVTVQRHIPQGKRAFRFLTPGVTTDDFISNNWQMQTHITGSTSGANGFDQTVSGNPSMFTYNNQQTTGSGWEAIANTNATNLNAGQGYRLLVRGDRTPTNITAASLPLMNTAVTLAATGTVTTGTVTFNTASATPINNTTNTTTNGFSLIGNPYVNTVNWNNLTKNDLTDAYYAWDANMGTPAQRGRYVVYSTTLGSNNGASAVNEFIQPGQAFFVKNSTLGTAGSITFQENNKIGGSSVSNQVFSEPAPLARIELQVYETNELALNSYPIDAAVALFDASFDSNSQNTGIEKLSTGTENLAFRTNNQNWTIQTNALPQATDEVQIDLNQFVANKNYSFKTVMQNMDSNLTPYLLDAYTNQYTELPVNTTTIHAFQTNDEAASYANNRFKIVFQNTTLNNPEFNESALTLYPNPITNGQFNIALPSSITGEVNISITNLLGQTVYENKVNAAPTIAVQTNTHLAQAVYVVTISNNGKSVTKKITVK